MTEKIGTLSGIVTSEDEIRKPKPSPTRSGPACSCYADCDHAAVFLIAVLQPSTIFNLTVCEAHLHNRLLRLRKQVGENAVIALYPVNTDR